MKISVLLPGYNAEKYMRETLDSIVEQTFRDFELVYIDDGSSDRSIEIVESYRDKLPALNIIKNETNQMLARTLNIGLEACKGDYIYRIDADDCLVPETLEKMYTTLKKHRDCDGIICDRNHIDEKGILYRRSLTFTEDYYLKKHMMFRTAYGGQPCLIKKDKWFEAGLHEETLKAVSDRDMGLKMTPIMKFVGIPEPLYIYREHRANTTTGSASFIKTDYYQNYFKHLTEKTFKIEDYINDWKKVKHFKTLEFDYKEERQKKYANTILRCAMYLAEQGMKDEALEEIKKAEFMWPKNNYRPFAFMIKNGFKRLKKFWINMNCWFRYTYDDKYDVDL